MLADPRVTDIGRHAGRTLQFKVDTDVAMLNALILTVSDEGLTDQAFIRDRASNFEALRDNVKGHSPEAMVPVCGVPAETLRIMHKCLAPDSDPHKVRSMYIAGENTAMSDPDLNHARQALANQENLVVQDIFMTETAWLADVVLPATAWPEKIGTVNNTDRVVQLRQAGYRPARRRAGLICGSSSRWPPAWAWTGAMKATPMAWQPCTKRCGARCMPPFRAPPGSGWSMNRVSPIPAWARTTRARRRYSSTASTPPVDGCTCYRQTSFRPTSGPMPLTRSC